MHIAVKTRNVKIFDRLIDVGDKRIYPDLNIQDNNGQTIIHLVASGKGIEHVNIFDKLKEIGDINPYIQDNNGHTPLHLAVFHGNVNIFDKLIDVGDKKIHPGLNIQDNNGQTIIHLVASGKGIEHVNIFDRLIEVGGKEIRPDLNIQDNNGHTPLHLAVLQGNVNMLDRLIDVGDKRIYPDLNIQDNNGQTIIHLVASGKGIEHVNIFDKLKEIGDINPYIQDNNGHTPLHLAVLRGNINMFNRLIGVGDEDVQIDLQDNDGQTLMSLANDRKNLDIGYIIDRLKRKGGVFSTIQQDENGQTPLYSAIQQGADYGALLKSPYTKARNKDGRTPLHLAVEKKDRNLVEKLISKGSNINVRDKNGITPLHLAVQKNDESLVEELISKGSDVNAKDKNGETPIYIAVKKERENLVEKLIEKGANINIRNKNGQTLVHFAAERGQIRLVSRTASENINIRNSKGQTILHWAVEEGHEDLVKKFIQRKVDVDAQDIWRQTPLHLIARLGNRKQDVNIAENLINAGANVNIRDNLGRVPLHWAAYQGYEYIVQKFLDHERTDINVKDDYGKTPLCLAHKKGNRRVYDKIREKSSFNFHIVLSLEKLISQVPQQELKIKLQKEIKQYKINCPEMAALKEAKEILKEMQGLNDIRTTNIVDSTNEEAWEEEWQTIGGKDWEKSFVGLIYSIKPILSDYKIIYYPTDNYKNTGLSDSLSKLGLFFRILYSEKFRRLAQYIIIQEYSALKDKFKDLHEVLEELYDKKIKAMPKKYEELYDKLAETFLIEEKLKSHVYVGSDHNDLILEFKNKCSNIASELKLEQLDINELNSKIDGLGRREGKNRYEEESPYNYLLKKLSQQSNSLAKEEDCSKKVEILQMDNVIRYFKDVQLLDHAKEHLEATQIVESSNTAHKKAVLFVILRLGEYAKSLSEHVKLYIDLPWSSLKDLRNILAKENDRQNYNNIQKAITTDDTKLNEIINKDWPNLYKSVEKLSEYMNKKFKLENLKESLSEIKDYYDKLNMFLLQDSDKIDYFKLESFINFDASLFDEFTLTDKKFRNFQEEIKGSKARLEQLKDKALNTLSEINVRNWENEYKWWFLENKFPKGGELKEKLVKDFSDDRKKRDWIKEYLNIWQDRQQGYRNKIQEIYRSILEKVKKSFSVSTPILIILSLNLLKSSFSRRSSSFLTYISTPRSLSSLMRYRFDPWTVLNI